MHNNDNSPLKRLQQLLATAPCAFEFFSHSAVPTGNPMAKALAAAGLAPPSAL